MFTCSLALTRHFSRIRVSKIALWLMPSVVQSDFSISKASVVSLK